MLNIKIALFLLTIICAASCDCIHDQFIKNTTIHYYNDLTQRRMLQTVTTGGLRIFADYTQLNAGNLLQRNYIRRMMNITANYFFNLLTVERLTRLFFPANTSQTCKFIGYLGNILTIPSVYVTQGTIGDVGIIVGSQNVTTLYMAKSTPCAFLQSNKRPIWGVIIWNVNSFRYNNEGFQQMMFVGLHQMTHVLAFSALMYSMYPRGSILASTPDGDYFLRSNNLTSQVRNHYNCSTAAGLDLQDQDGTLIASHWQKHHVGNQFMIASNKKNTYISRFTLSIFASTGWYPSVNFSLAQPITWGKNQGCNFLNIDNCNFDQFCNDNAFDCDWDATGIGRCAVDVFTGSCSLPKYFNNTICIDEKYQLNNLNAPLLAQERGGSNSRCHNSNYRQAGLAANILNNRCYITVCSLSGSFIYILVGGYTLVCRSAGQVIPSIPGFDGTLTCPSDFSLYCAAKKTCAFNCNQNGACINGQCLCTGATTFTATCSATNPAQDPQITTGGRILFEILDAQKKKEQKKILRRQYSFKNKCSEGYIFDPISKTCQFCQQFLGCKNCNQHGCIK